MQIQIEKIIIIKTPKIGKHNLRITMATATKEAVIELKWEIIKEFNKRGLPEMNNLRSGTMMREPWQCDTSRKWK